MRPRQTLEKGLAETVEVSLVEVTEVDPPAGAEPILWRLLATHAVEDVAMAWRVVGWYRRRWTIEQVFRTFKQQGLRLEDSQLKCAERLIKLTAMAATAAAVIMQFVQARDGQSREDADIAFSPAEIQTLQALMPEIEGKTALQKNPHPPGPWPGPPGSSPSSADGTDIPSPSLQVPSPSDTACNTSDPSPEGGDSEMCKSPSASGERD